MTQEQQKMEWAEFDEWAKGIDSPCRVTAWKAWQARAALAAPPADHSEDAGQMVPSASAQEAEAVARVAVEQFKSALYQVPYFADRVNKATREKLSEAHSIVLNLPALLDQVNLAAPVPAASPAALSVAIKALEHLAAVPGCGCAFPCRCGGAEWTRAELEGRMDVASEALAEVERLLAAQPAADARDEIIKTQRETLERTWHVLKKHGAHPGRTDDFLHDCVDRALSPADHSGDSADMVAIPPIMYNGDTKRSPALRQRIERWSEEQNKQMGAAIDRVFDRPEDDAHASRQGVALSDSRGYHVLRNAIASLKAEGQYRDDEGEDTDALESLADALSRASSSRAEVERDAERYRRIRNGPHSDRHGDVYAMVFMPDGDAPIHGAKLDSIIDAALRASQEGE